MLQAPTVTDWDASTLTGAIAGLRDRAVELSDYPDRLHVAGVQPRDLLGAPKLSPAFWRYLTGKPDSTHTVTETVICPLRHESADCARCGGLGSYPKTRAMYDRPLALALRKLANAKSPQRPHPIYVILALLSEGYSIERTALRLGIIIMDADQRKTEEARILSAIRALRLVFEDTDYRPDPGWLNRSDAQRSAEDAA